MKNSKAVNTRRSGHRHAESRKQSKITLTAEDKRLIREELIGARDMYLEQPDEKTLRFLSIQKKLCALIGIGRPGKGSELGGLGKSKFVVIVQFFGKPDDWLLWNTL